MFREEALRAPADRLRLISTGVERHEDDFAREVESGLTDDKKRLPCRFFYDRIGSRLFEEVCELPEYYLTRAEREILETYAAEITALLPRDIALVELGSGSSVKTRILIRALLARNGSLRYYPVDISHTMLRQSSLNLLEAHPALEVIAINAEYDQGLRHLSSEEETPRLILFLGSSLGNFESEDARGFLSKIRQCMRDSDRFLIGLDLKKDRETLEKAYDDGTGVTARFNLNLLSRINRELGGKFDLDSFRHRAFYNAERGRVEIYITSLRSQTVPIERLNTAVSFEKGESIHTENSHKYSIEDIESLAEDAELELERQWFDSQRRFSLNLLRCRGPGN